MPQIAEPRHSVVGRLIFLLALLGLALLPVEYRGGAASPHAHAAFQLWWDAAAGVLNHHPDAALALSFDRHKPASVRSRQLPPAGASALHLVSPGDAVGLFAIAASAVVPAAIDRRRAVPSWQTASGLRDRVVRPESPPPRFAVVG